MRPYLSPFKFAWDEGNSAGVIVGRVGPCTIVRGTGADEGSWFARGKGQTRRFDSRQAAYDWAKSHGTDSGVENMRRFKTQDCGMDAEPDLESYVGKTVKLKQNTIHGPRTVNGRVTRVLRGKLEVKITSPGLGGYEVVSPNELAQDAKPADYVKYAAKNALK